MKKNACDLARRVVGPFENHCCGCPVLPSGAYVTTPLIGTGVTTIACAHSGSQLLDHIIAFDRAEASFANITQTNLVQVSSFNGPQGLLLGYDILRQEKKRHPLVSLEKHPNVFDAEPLMQATRALYGTIQNKRFPILPGQHVLSAYKAFYKNGPCLLYGALAIAIAEDRTRDADLFMEDHGTLVATRSEAADQEQETTVLENLIDSVHRIGDNLSVRYERLFVGLRIQPVQAGQVGCVLTAAPYIHLAKNAVRRSAPELLPRLSLAEWEEETKMHYRNH